MIHIILRGDFGNQLFQYAIGRKLALQHNTGLQLNVSNRLSLTDWNGQKLMGKLNPLQLPVQFSYWPPLATKFFHKIGANKIFSTGAFFREIQWGFDPDVLALPDQSYLFGYFQSEKYFKDIASIIRSDLKIKVGSNHQQVLDMADKIRGTESVSIHIRRGDYLKSARHNVCNLDYYANATDFMQTHLTSPHFFVFSDDIAWCKANLKINHCNFVDIPLPSEQPMIDFQLMSLCRHHIIANSSFSWWAAWLSSYPEKIVAAPNRWYNDEPINSQAIKDTIPDDWSRIDF